MPDAIEKVSIIVSKLTFRTCGAPFTSPSHW
jgi:hypothetical protein